MTVNICLHAEIVAIISDLEKLRNIMANTHSHYTADDIYCVVMSLRYRLLLWSPTEKTSTESNILSEACCVGLLLYLKPAICCQVTYKSLIERLRTCLDSIKVNIDMRRHEIAEFLLWLLFLGGTTTLYGLNKAWLIHDLGKTVRPFGLNCWADVKLVLMKFLWSEETNEALFLNLWEEVLLQQNFMEQRDKEKSNQLPISS